MTSPYTEYTDYQLLLRYLKLCNDFKEYIDIPMWAGLKVDFSKSQSMAIKIDKIVIECYLRGLMGQNGKESKLSPEEQTKIAQKGLEYLKSDNTTCFEAKETPFSTTLTTKGELLQVWNDNSLNNKYHEFIHYLDNETYEKIRKKSCDEDNEKIRNLKF